MGRVTIKLVISGRVQGVSFRAFMRENAIERGVEGWVRNRDDGSVEALVQGEEEDVLSIVEWTRRGPPAAKVSSVTQQRLDAHPRQSGFEILT